MRILSLPIQCMHRQVQIGVLVTIKLIYGFSDGNRCFKKLCIQFWEIFSLKKFGGNTNLTLE